MRHGTALLLALLLSGVSVPDSAAAAPSLGEPDRFGAFAPQAAPDPGTQVGPFGQRLVLATVGAFGGAVVAGYGTWALKGGEDGCDLCWEATAATVVGGIVGGAMATRFAGTSMRRALIGSLVGAAAGAAVVGILDGVADPDETALTLSFVVPYGLITAWLSGG